MAYRHFLRIQRTVRIGGLKIGPLVFGGGWYTVGPLSVLRVFQILQALPADAPSDLVGKSIAKLISSVPIPKVAAFLPLLVQEPVKRRHARRMRSTQVLALMIALGQTNDTEYIAKKVLPAGGEPGADVGDFLHAVVCASHGAWNHDEVLRMPMQEALAILDSAVNATREVPLPAGAEPLSEAEQRDLQALCMKAGIGVN